MSPKKLDIENLKGTCIIQFRVSPIQVNKLRTLATANGHRTLSSYIRSRCFDDVATQEKLNILLNTLNELKSRKEVVNGKEKKNTLSILHN